MSIAIFCVIYVMSRKKISSENQVSHNYETMSKILPFVEDTLPGEVEAYKEPETTKKSQSPVEKPATNDETDTKPKDNKKDEVTSFSYEQVNDDADELIELRGEGRYFGVTDPSSGKTVNSLQSLGPLCGNCHKRGHVRAKCKTVVCHKCGVVGDHYEAQCPTTMICSRCGVKGHMASDCTAKQRKKQYCKSCDTFNHGDYNCPMIWRSYLTKSKDLPDKLPVIYCYNCGSDRHYGDECSEERTSRVPNFGSAFSGSNLPKQLRSLYYDTLRGKPGRNLPKPSNKGKYQNKNNQNSGSNSYNDSRNYSNSNYYNKNSNNGANNKNGGYNSKNGHRNGYNNYPQYNNPGNIDFSISNNFNSSRNYSSNNDRNFGKTSFNNGNVPTRSGYISKKSKNTGRNVPNRSGYISKGVKPTKSGLIEKSKSKRRQMKY